jgi:hypothetical protein
MLQINFSKQSTKQLDYLGEQTIALSKKNTNQEAVGNPVFLQLETSHELYRQIVIKKTYSGIGEVLKEVDILRDRYYLNLGRIIDGFAVFETTTKSQPARVLQAMFKETGAVTGLTYADESVVIDKLLEKLATPEGQSAITQLDISAEVQLLSDTQKRFNELYVEQVDANSDLRQQSSASAMRKELEGALRNYFALISAMKNVAPWADIYSDMTELLKKF